MSEQINGLWNERHGFHDVEGLARIGMRSLDAVAADDGVQSKVRAMLYDQRDVCRLGLVQPRT